MRDAGAPEAAQADTQSELGTTGRGRSQGAGRHILLKVSFSRTVDETLSGFVSFANMAESHLWEAGLNA